jgi:hypothetical protein
MSVFVLLLKSGVTILASLLESERNIMDWAGFAEHNRANLMRIVMELFVLARIAPGERPERDPAAASNPLMTTLPRYVYRAVMLILEPAEAAMRRLLIIAAQGLVLKAVPPRSAPIGIIASKGDACAHMPSFNMFDPTKSFWDFWRTEMEGYVARPFPAELPEPQRFAPVNAVSMWRRINALHDAISDLPKAVRRFARWKARRNLAIKENRPIRPQRLSPMRPGYAPGYRKKRLHEVDDILRECHGLAQEILTPPKRPWLQTAT